MTPRPAPRRGVPMLRAAAILLAVASLPACVAPPPPTYAQPGYGRTVPGGDYAPPGMVQPQPALGDGIAPLIIGVMAVLAPHAVQAALGGRQPGAY